MQTFYFNALATVSGLLLALMVYLNAALGQASTAGFSSIVTHLVGGVASYLLWISFSKAKGFFPKSKEAPIHSYLGGMIGAFIVILSSITVNSYIALSGTIALAILGQVVFSVLSDVRGWFGLVARKFDKYDFFQMFFILMGTAIILFG